MSLRHACAALCLLVLTSCASLAPPAQLSEEEQGLYRVYSRIMTSKQLRTYRELSIATERAAYAQQVGAAQRLAVLSQQDRMAVLRGYPFEGMSREALRLLWGEPYMREGPAQYERWYYYGDAFSLASIGSSTLRGDTVMEAALENGYLVWWQERIPSERHRSIFKRRGFGNPAD
jgi:hypothetical protein